MPRLLKQGRGRTKILKGIAHREYQTTQQIQSSRCVSRSQANLSEAQEVRCD